MAQQGWSSLPADLVNRVADCILATNDIDYYMDLRAVCHGWRSSTADPRTSRDERFHPTRWIVLDELSSDTSRLFVNTSTGRFLRMRMPLLGDYHFVTSTTGGFLVLAEKEPPHAVGVLNPFTASLIRYAAPLPAEPRFTAAVAGSSPTLVLVSVSSHRVFWAANPQSESFSVDETHSNCPANRLPLIAAGKCAATKLNRASDSDANMIFDQLLSEVRCRFHVVEAPGGEMLAALKRRHGVDVFKIDSAGNVLQRVKSIGSLALFLGVRSFVVDANRFAAVDPNCAYFQLTDVGLRPLPKEVDIYKFDLEAEDEEDEPELVSAAMADEGTWWRCKLRPFTVTQHLCNYTMDIPPLTWCRSSRYTGGISSKEADRYREYTDHVGMGSEFMGHGMMIAILNAPTDLFDEI